MIRRLNYTGRRRIARSQVMVRLVPAADGVWSFDADFTLAEHDFPAESSVFIEAYNATRICASASGWSGARSCRRTGG